MRTLGPPPVLLPVALLALLDLPVTSLPGAACRGQAPLFDEQLPDETPDEQDDRHQQARQVCARCPAREPCAAAVPDLPRSSGGIWAGRLLSGERHTARYRSDQEPRTKETA